MGLGFIVKFWMPVMSCNPRILKSLRELSVLSAAWASALEPCSCYAGPPAAWKGMVRDGSTAG